MFVNRKSPPVDRWALDFAVSVLNRRQSYPWCPPLEDRPPPEGRLPLCPPPPPEGRLSPRPPPPEGRGASIRPPPPPDGLGASIRPPPRGSYEGPDDLGVTTGCLMSSVGRPRP